MHQLERLLIDVAQRQMGHARHIQQRQGFIVGIQDQTQGDLARLGTLGMSAAGESLGRLVEEQSAGRL